MVAKPKNAWKRVMQLSRQWGSSNAMNGRLNNLDMTDDLYANEIAKDAKNRSDSISNTLPGIIAAFFIIYREAKREFICTDIVFASPLYTLLLMRFTRSMAFELPHWRLLAITAIHVLLGYTVFFFLSVTGNMGDWVKELANQSIYSHYGVVPTEDTIGWIWSITNACVVFGSSVCGFTFNYAAEILGRRTTAMVVKNVLMIVAGLLQVLSRPLNCIELLLLGRILTGFAILYTCFIAVYVAECIPVKYRGIIPSFLTMVGSRLWLFIGSFAGLFVTESNWHYAFLCPVFLSVLHLATTPFIPRSVKHLYITKGQAAIARKATILYNGPNVNMEKLQTEMLEEGDISPTVKVADIRLLFVAKQFRWPMLIVLVSTVMMPVGGIDIAFFYSGSTLQNAGVPLDKVPLYNSVFVNLPSLFVAMLAAYLIERFGRRMMMLVGVVFGGIGTLFLSFVTPFELVNLTMSAMCGILGLCFCLLSNTLGPGVIPYVLPGELVPQASRSITVGLSNGASQAISLIITLGFPFVNAALGSYIILLFVLGNVLGFLFLYKYLPETKGKTVAALVAKWMPPRKSGCITASEAKFVREIDPLIPKVV